MLNYNVNSIFCVWMKVCFDTKFINIKHGYHSITDGCIWRSHNQNRAAQLSPLSPTIDWWWDLFNKYLERLIELEKKKNSISSESKQAVSNGLCAKLLLVLAGSYLIPQIRR